MQSTYFKYLFLILNLVIITVFLLNFQDFPLYQRFLSNNGYTITITLFVIYLSHLSLKLTDLIVESIKHTENRHRNTPRKERVKNSFIRRYYKKQGSKTALLFCMKSIL